MNLGQLVVIKGEIIATENLHIAGRVEGSILLEDGAVLTLAAGSTVVGEVVAANVEVLGCVEGGITATERLAIRSTAEINGTITAPLLSVQEGARILAKIEMPAREKPKAGAGTPDVVGFPVAV
ncbi:MAG: bactofilin family protein [Bacteroidales bacterium]